MTGRHYSGFIMLGIQVFNYPENFVFFKEECVEFNFKWLTEELGIPKEEITFVEDVWAGGGNLGPSIEYFVRGLELGNMVFMQYKTFHDGSREELKIKIIDTGIGLERIAWLMNGTATSYMDTFRNAFEWFTTKTKLDVNLEIWEKFGPFSSQLDVDEADDIDKTWQQIADLIGLDVKTVKEAVAPVKDMYIVLDHSRTLMMTIIDGSLPSNVGGGGNVRNILRRTFFTLKKRGWWDMIGGMDGFIELFKMHQRDLEGICGAFEDYKSFRAIIEIEFERWNSTDEVQKKNLKKMVDKSKGSLTIDDWILAIQSYGISADRIAEITKFDIPNNLYYEIAIRQERQGTREEQILYDTVHLPETDNLYYKNHNLYAFEGKVTDIFANVKDNGKMNIVILDRSAFYPTSGGQLHDCGTMQLEGQEYQVVNVEKVGKSILHFLSEEIKGEKEDLIGKPVACRIDVARRAQLRCHHTATHIMYAACKRVLGPHVWQHGAKKTTQNAHLDITHFKSLTREEEVEIENTANRVISECVGIEKYFMDKSEAEKAHGFRLYQGGVVPGNELRVVDISGIDTEACCGTHCDNTAEVGWVRLLKSQRISDGIVRLYYVAHERAISQLNEESELLHNLC